MKRTQIYLTARESEALRTLSGRKGRTQSDLIRQAIDEFLTRTTPVDRLTRLRRARGMWRGRDDLSAADLRADFDRFDPAD